MKPLNGHATTLAIGLATIVGAVAAVAQIVDYQQTRKFNYVILAAYVVAAAVFVLFSPELVRRIRGWRRRRSAAQPSQNSVTWVAPTALVVIAVATMVVATTAVWALVNSNSSVQFSVPRSQTSSAREGSPTASTPISELRNPQVFFRKPASNLAIDWGSNVDVEGTASFLGANSLWLLTKPQAGGGHYYLTEHTPVTHTDGDWFYTDSDVGDLTDKGKTITYLAIMADPTCATTSSKADETIEELPRGCKQLASVSIHVN